MSLEYSEEKQSDQLDAAEPPRPSRPPIPIYTTTLIVALGIVFLAQLAEGIPTPGERPGLLIEILLGAPQPSIDRAGFVKSLFLYDHEYWRILTGAVVHGFLLHLFLNCYAFYSFGRIFEILSDRAHLAIVFLLSAIGGGVLSLLLLPDAISVGASGGIVGLVSYLAVYSFKRRNFITPQFRKSLLVNIGFILVFGLVLYQVVDNWGHIGGLITGGIYGLIQIPTDEYTDPRTASKPTEYAGVVALGISLASCAFAIAKIIRLI